MVTGTQDHQYVCTLSHLRVSILSLNAIDKFLSDMVPFYPLNLNTGLRITHFMVSVRRLANQI